MNNVKVFALGGLEENGKNLYVVETNDKIFVLDAGIKYPTVEFFGINYILPDFSYLIKNKDKIAGLFLSHAHDDQIGAVKHILKELNINVYGSKFTIEVLKENLKEFDLNIESYKLYTVNDQKTLKFGETIVSFIKLTHDIPESLGISITTNEGNILYITDYTLHQYASNKYKTSFSKIADQGKNNNLALLVDSSGVLNKGLAQTHNELMNKLNSNFTDAKGRIIISLFSSNLKRIQQVIDVTIEHKKKLAIIGKRTQKLVSLAVANGYIKLPDDFLVNLKFIDEKNTNNQKDLVILVAGDRHEPYFMVQRMCKKIDRLVHIDSNDTVILLTTPVMGTEKMAAKTLDILFRTNAKIIRFNKSLLQTSHASSDEIQILLNMLKPKYIIPIKGEYRHMLKVLEIAQHQNYTEDSIILAQNGDVINFSDNKYNIEGGQVTVTESLVDGSLMGDVNDVILRDRELLSEDGVILVCTNISQKNKQILAGPEIISKGFLELEDNKELVKEIENIFNKVTEKQLEQQSINWKNYKKDLKESISKYIYKNIKRSPIVIPVTINIDL